MSNRLTKDERNFIATAFRARKQELETSFTGASSINDVRTLVSQIDMVDSIIQKVTPPPAKATSQTDA